MPLAAVDGIDMPIKNVGYRRSCGVGNHRLADDKKDMEPHGCPAHVIPDNPFNSKINYRP
jgi:hypothetical protein